MLKNDIIFKYLHKLTEVATKCKSDHLNKIHYLHILLIQVSVIKFTACMHTINEISLLQLYKPHFLI